MKIKLIVMINLLLLLVSIKASDRVLLNAKETLPTAECIKVYRMVTTSGAVICAVYTKRFPFGLCNHTLNQKLVTGDLEETGLFFEFLGAQNYDRAREVLSAPLDPGVRRRLQSEIDNFQSANRNKEKIIWFIKPKKKSTCALL